MFNRLKQVLKALAGGNRKEDDSARWDDDDRDAGIPVRVRRNPPDRGSSVAVAEPDE